MSRTKLPDKDFEWTPELAYAVGLIATDGNLSKDGRHINFTSKDKELVELFRECLHLNNEIGRKNSGSCSKKKYHQIQFGNVVFFHWLQRIGLTPNKSKTVGSLKIPNEYFADFLRGHLDGDGNIYAYIDRYNSYRGCAYTNQRIFVRFISASSIHINWLYRKINILVGFKGALIYNPPPTSNRVPIWEIKFAKKESIKLLKWIYYKENLPCLKRKRVIAEKTIEKISKEKRKKYTKIKI